MNYILYTEDRKIANLTEETYKDILANISGYFGIRLGDEMSGQKVYWINENASLKITSPSPGLFSRADVIKLHLWKGMYLVEE